MMVGADDWNIFAGRREGYLVNACTKFNFAAEELGQFGVITIAPVNEPHPLRDHAAACQMQPQTHQRHHEKFDLMPVQIATNADITKGYADIFADEISGRYAFIRD